MAAIRGSILTSASSASAPTSATIGSIPATVAGNLLLFAVACTSSGTPTITSPGGSWTQIFNVSKSGLAYALFANLNNAGGVTSVSATLATTTAGGAVAHFAELQGIGTGQANDSQVTASGATATVAWPSISPVLNNQELLYYGVARASATYTPNNTAEWNLGNVSTTSTGATTNCSLDSFFGIMPYELSQPSGGGTLGSAVANYIGFADFLHSLAFPMGLSYTPAGGNAGLYVGKFNQGMIGG